MKCDHCEQEIYYGMHVCQEEIQHIKKAASDVWDSVTDLLSQSDIDRIENIHRNDLDTLGIF